MATRSNSFSLQIFLQKFPWIAYTIRAQSIKIFNSKASQIKQSSCKKIQRSYFGFCFWNLIFEDCVGISHKLIGNFLKVYVVVEIINGHYCLKIKTQSYFSIGPLYQSYQFTDQFE